MGGARRPEGLVPIRNERGTPATGFGRAASATRRRPRERTASPRRVDGVGTGSPEPNGRPPADRRRSPAFPAPRDRECSQRIKGTAAARQSVPDSLRRTVRAVRLTHTGNRVD
jgi:hypothetical protein